MSTIFTLNYTGYTGVTQLGSENRTGRRLKITGESDEQ